MNNLCHEITASIERFEDEFAPFAIMAYSKTRAVVIWSDDNFTRTEFEILEHELPFQDCWDYTRGMPYTLGGEGVECVHIDGDVDQDSLEDELERLNECL